MSLIKYKPTSPGIRHLVRIKNNELYKGKPIKKLIKFLKKTGGRNNIGRITTRHIGGRHKRFYRKIDFKRNDNLIGKVVRFEYDPNRSSNIALINYNNNINKYILLPKGLKLGDKISFNKGSDISIGNSLFIKNIPIGNKLHNVELHPGKGGQLARAAGSYVNLISKNNKYAIVRLKSGEIRNIQLNCKATIGEIGNSENSLISLGKAGSSRWRGIRPTVRGTAMNPIDHPHGGGEGKNFGKHPVTPWGKYTKGKKTRKNKNNKFILKKRKK